MHLHANEDPTRHPEMGRPHSRDRATRLPSGLTQPTMVRHVLALQRSVGNAATTYWLQREEGGDSEETGGGPMDSVETGIGYADDANAIHVASKTVGLSITEVIAENAGDIGNMSEGAMWETAADSAVLSPLVLAAGTYNIVEGVQQGDPSRVVSGGFEAVSGGAGILAAGVPAAGVVAPVAAAGAAGMEFGNAGIAEAKRSGVDLPGWAADQGDWVRRKTGSRVLGGVATVGASVPAAVGAAAYGVKAVARGLLRKPAFIDEMISGVAPSAANIDLPTIEEIHDVMDARVAQVEAPPLLDSWAGSSESPPMTKAKLAKARQAIQGFLLRLANAPVPKRPRRPAG